MLPKMKYLHMHKFLSTSTTETSFSYIYAPLLFLLSFTFDSYNTRAMRKSYIQWCQRQTKKAEKSLLKRIYAGEVGQLLNSAKELLEISWDEDEDIKINFDVHECCSNIEGELEKFLRSRSTGYAWRTIFGKVLEKVQDMMEKYWKSVGEVLKSCSSADDGKDC